MAYTLTADQIPAPVVPSGFVDPQGTDVNSVYAPAALPALVNGMAPIDGVPVLHQWARSIEALGRDGAGGRCINRGLVPSDSGDPLTVEFTAGQALIDIPVTLADGGTCVVSNNIYDAGDITVRIHLWLTQGGLFTSVNNSLTPPSTNCVYLGSCRTDSGAFVDFDLSGRMQRLQGGALVRRTADLGEPADTPPSTISFRARTEGGVYEWTGEEWVDAAVDSKTVFTSGDHTTSGTLADLITVGVDAGLTVDVEEVTTGVWKLVLRSVLGDVDLSALLKTDGTNAMLAPLDMGAQKIIALAAGTLNTDAVNLLQMNTAIAAAVAAVDLTPYFKKDGTRKATGAFDMDGQRIKNVPTVPTAGTDAINDDRLTAQLAGFSTTDRQVRSDSSDTTPGDLDTKVTVSRGLEKSVTGPGSGDRKFNLALDVHEETLPKFEVVCPPGEERIIRIRFGAADSSTSNDRGSFPDDLPYEVIPRVSAFEGSDPPPEERFTLEELVSQNDVLNGSTDTTHTKIKNGKVCFLRLRNHSPNDWDGGTSDQTNSFWLTVFLRGVGWVAGASPSADPDVSIYDYTSWHTETFTLSALTIPKGATGLVEVDFSGLGTFQDEYFIAANPANDDANAWVLSSGRTGNTFRLKVENAAGAASTDVTLTCTVHGRRWWDVDDTLNPDTPGSPSASVTVTTIGQEQISLATFKEEAPGGTGEILLRYPCHKAITIGGTATLAISQAICMSLPATSAEIEIHDWEVGVGSTLIGLLTFGSVSNSGTFDFATYGGEVTVGVGHMILFKTGAGSADAAQFCINLIGLIDRD